MISKYVDIVAIAVDYFTSIPSKQINAKSCAGDIQAVFVELNIKTRLNFLIGSKACLFCVKPVQNFYLFRDFNMDANKYILSPFTDSSNLFSMFAMASKTQYSL